MPDRSKAVVLLSGGLDSSTCLALAAEAGCDLIALSADYGQRHSVELECARVQASRMNAFHLVVKIDTSLFRGSALTDEQIDVPSAKKDSDEIPITYVPARNTVLLSQALAVAESYDAAAIYIGANAVDYSGYPDCRPEFIDAFRELARLATRTGVEGRPIRIEAPLLRMPKGEIVREAVRLGVDLSRTSSCYSPGPEGRCGACDSCLLRQRGFQDAGLPDPAA